MGCVPIFKDVSPYLIFYFIRPVHSGVGGIDDEAGLDFSCPLPDLIGISQIQADVGGRPLLYFFIEPHTALVPVMTQIFLIYFSFLSCA